MHPKEIVRRYSIWFYILLLCLLFILVLSIAVKSESASMKDLRYEILGDFYYYNTSSPNNFYEEEVANFSVNKDGYYNITNHTSLLCDSYIFNFTSFDEFYIEVYNPSETDLNLIFVDSFIYGEDYGAGTTITAQKSEYFTDEWDDNLPDTTLNPNFPNAHIGTYYNMDSDMINGERIYNGENPGSFTTSPWKNHKNGEVNVTLDLSSPHYEFQKFTIDIKNNFLYEYPELRRFCRILLTNVSNDSYVYIRDYGFNKDGALNTSFNSDGITYYMFYGDNQRTVLINYSNEHYSEIAPEICKTVLSSYDDTVIHCFNWRFKSRDYGNYWDYEVDFRNYATTLDSTSDHWGSNVHLAPGQFTLIDGYADSGTHYFLNKNSFVEYHKEFFHYESTTQDYIRYNMRKITIDYQQEKYYYGMLIQDEHGSLTVHKINEEIDEIDSEIRQMDYSEVEVENIQKDKSPKMYKLKGDWGAFDSIRKGINKILEVIQIVIFGILSFFEPIWTWISDVISPIVELVAGLAVIQGFIVLIDTVLDSTFNFLVNTLPGFIIDVYNELVDIAGDIGQLLLDLTEIIGLLTLADIIYSLIVYAIDGVTILIAVMTEFITWLGEWIGVFIDLVTVAFDLLLSFLLLFLLSVIALTMSRIAFSIEDNADNLGEILESFVSLMLAPLKAIYRMVAGLVDIVLGIIPF